jgi:zinc protease
VTKLPLVSVASVDAGAVRDSAGHEGVARLAAKLMLEGTEKYDGAELTERFERLGASIDAEADWDEAALTMTVMSDRLAAAFDLLGEVLRTPAFPQREVDRLKAERQAELLQLRAEPRGLADELFTRFLYTPSSRYARPDGGDESSVAGIERSNVRAFYESRYVPAATTVIVVGDVTADRAEELAKSTLAVVSSRPSRIAADAAPSRPAARSTSSRKRTPRNLSCASGCGHTAQPPDYFAVNDERTRRSVQLPHQPESARSARLHVRRLSVFDWRRASGPFLVQTAVRSDITDAAAAVISEIDWIARTALARTSWALATSYLDGCLPIRFETTAAIAAALSVFMFMICRGLLRPLSRARRAVTREQILRCGSPPASGGVAFVAVGDPPRSASGSPRSSSDPLRCTSRG